MVSKCKLNDFGNLLPYYLQPHNEGLDYDKSVQ